MVKGVNASRSEGIEKDSKRTSSWLKFDEFEKQGMSCMPFENVQFDPNLTVVGQTTTTAFAPTSYLAKLLI